MTAITWHALRSDQIDSLIPFCYKPLIISTSMVKYAFSAESIFKTRKNRASVLNLLRSNPKIIMTTTINKANINSMLMTAS